LTVTGKAAAVADAVPAGLLVPDDGVVLLADVVVLAGVVLLADEPQPARAVAQAAPAARAATSRRGVLIRGYFLPIGGKEGETVGRRGGRDGSPFPRGPISSNAPESTWLRARVSGLITVAGQRRNGLAGRGGTGFAT
jgi:hypothetical protein